jgi:arylsulfatase A-like enzyme
VSVVVYLVDALRADRLGVYGHGRDISPRLDAFASRATVYERALAQSSWTRPAVASLLTGLRPEVHGANRRLDRLGDGPAVLPELLAAAGYQTAAVVANPNASAEFGLGRGFESFTLMAWDERRSERLNAVALDWLDRRDTERPFLLWIHTVDPHLPYDPPPRLRARFAPSVVGDLGTTERVGALQARDLEGEERLASDLLDLYDAEVASNDAAFGELLDALEARGLLDGALVFFLSDHGEEFFDHGGWIHGHTLYREVLHVPLVVKWPGQRVGRRVASPVQQVDLLPTVMDLLGLPAPAGLHGASLLGALPEDRPIAGHLEVDEWRAASVEVGSYKAVRHGHLGYPGRPELYRVDDDPRELEDLAPALGVLAGTLLTESRAAILGEEDRFHGAEAVIDAEMRRRLEALGYF